MEAAMNLLSSSPPIPPRTYIRNNLPPSSTSVSILSEHASTAASSIPTTVAKRSPSSVLLQEQRDDFRFILKEGRISQSISEWKQIGAGPIVNKDDNEASFDEFLMEFKHQLLQLPGLSYLLSSFPSERQTSFSKRSDTHNMERFLALSPSEAVSLAMEALSASKQAVSLAENFDSIKADCDESISHRSPVTLFVEEKTVRSKRLLERRSKKRKVSKPKVSHENSSSGRVELRRKLSEGFDQNDPLRLFLGPETRKLLTVEEERSLIREIQDLSKLELVKKRLQSQFNREPTLIEWADAARLSCRDLQSQLRSGYHSRERLMLSNFRMVVHIAKQYQGRGLSLQDLLQEGSMGLMKSVEKFKPQAGCRFPSYAYWWIRQSVRKAIFQHSRTIRLPENMYSLLTKVLEAKNSYIQEMHRPPTKEQLAQRVGITVEKLQKLLFFTRRPLSLQQPIWSDQDITFQEVTPDTRIETPDISVAKQLMRQHMHNLLSTLCPKERQIIKLRYGIGSGHHSTLSEIGVVFGLSKERVRQLETRALNKLRQSLSSQGPNEYADLLV